MLNRLSLTLLAALMFAAAHPALAQHPRMNFFVTSSGSGRGADLGGIEGADEHCRALADRVGLGDRAWRAYLSTQAAGDREAINARDRIGRGPWYNFMGELIAQDVAELHGDSTRVNKETALTERGEPVPGRGDQRNWHDILTGSQADGTAFPPGDDRTCDNWTSSGEGAAQVGHHDRVGMGETASSWNSAHPSRGCSPQDLQASGGNGLFYCFIGG